MHKSDADENTQIQLDFNNEQVEDRNAHNQKDQGSYDQDHA